MLGFKWIGGLSNFEPLKHPVKNNKQIKIILIFIA